MKHWFISGVLGLALVAISVSGWCGPLDDIDRQIGALRLAQARTNFNALDQATKKLPRAQYLRGKLLFFEGQYAKAQKALRRAIEGAKAEIDWKILRDRVSRTERVLFGFETTRGTNGGFVFRYAQGPDALLVPYADHALNSQLRVLSTELGVSFDAPLEVVFMPDVPSLAEASGLTTEQIERTGTVGVSKYGRIMIITPRKLSTGYPWLDTLAHELTHIAITRASYNRAPVWLHEGIAKLMERRWRSDSGTDLTPEEAYLLDRAAKERRLIPLRKFHPSVAALPNQEDAALAYAQVLSFIRYLDERFEPSWIKSLLDKVGRGATVLNAFTQLSQSTLQRHYRWWQQSVSGKRQTPVPAVGLMKKRFIRGKTTDKSESESLLKAEVRQHLRIGDLLRLRSHVRAAVIEYQKAKQAATSPSPEISDRLAACLLELGEAKAVTELLPQMIELYPAHSTVFVQLGTAFAALNQNAEAVEQFERANAINPFHPQVHCTLAKLYNKLGRKKEAELEFGQCRLLTTEASAKE